MKKTSKDLRGRNLSKKLRSAIHREVMPGAEASKLPRKIWLIWVPGVGFYEPPFTRKQDAEEFASVEREDGYKARVIGAALVPMRKRGRNG